MTSLRTLYTCPLTDTRVLDSISLYGDAYQRKGGEIVDITVYLPDELGRKAKEAGINLSRMLRDAVEEEMDRREAVAETLGGAVEHLLECTDEEGRSYTGRLVGSLISDHDAGGRNVYLTEDERVLVHDEDEGWIEEVQQESYEEVLGRLLSNEAYLDAMAALGLKPVIDL
jgi:hypothetical protein